MEPGVDLAAGLFFVPDEVEIVGHNMHAAADFFVERMIAQRVQRGSPTGSCAAYVFKVNDERYNHGMSKADKVRELLAEGLRSKEIAKRAKCSVSYVYSLADRQQWVSNRRLLLDIKRDIIMLRSEIRELFGQPRDIIEYRLRQMEEEASGAVGARLFASDETTDQNAGESLPPASD